MTDLALIGFDFDGKGAVAAERAYDRLTSGSREVEAATRRAEEATRDLGHAARFGGGEAETVNRILREQSSSMNAARMGTQQLGFQINDLGTQISAGIKPMVAVNQQLGQIGWAMSNMQGKAAVVGSFLAGPWGAAIAIGGAAVSSLIVKIMEQNDALDEAIKKLRDDAAVAETARQAKEVYAASAEGVSAAVRDMNAELAKVISTTRLDEVATLNAAKANQQKTLAVREQLQAELELRKTLAEAGLRTAQQGNTQGEMAALNLPQLQRDLEAAQTALDKNATDIVAAQQAIRNAAVPIAHRYAEEMSTATGRITRQYDEMRDAAVTAANGNDQLTAALGDTLLTIEKQRQAAMDAEKATGRTQRGSSGASEYARLIDGARDYITSLQIEREQMGMTSIERERAESYRRADEIATKGQTAASIALAAQIKREADALAGVRGEYEKAEEAKRGTEGLQGMLTQLERQAQLIGASSEAQALLNTEWAISDLQIKEMSPEMQVLIDRIRQLARGNEAARREQDRYNDSLRLTLDLARQADDIMRDAASGFADAFGDAGKAIGGVLTSMTGLNATLKQIDEEKAERARNGLLTAEREIMLEQQKSAATIGAYGDMLSAARGYFAEGSDGYKAMMIVEQAYRAFQLASSIASIAQGWIETSQSVAQSGVKGTASAAAGAAKMFEILGPLGFPVVAAMLGLLAGLGLGGLGGGGGSTGAANDDEGPDHSTNAIRSYTSQDAQAREQATQTLAQAVRVQIEFNDPMFKARVQKEAVGATAPMVAAAAAGTKRDVFQTMNARQVGNRKVSV